MSLERFYRLEEVQNWSDFSYGGRENDFVKDEPLFDTKVNASVEGLEILTPIYGLRTVRKGDEWSAMVLIKDVAGEGSWVHLKNPKHKTEF